MGLPAHAIATIKMPFRFFAFNVRFIIFIICIFCFIVLHCASNNRNNTTNNNNKYNNNNNNNKYNCQANSKRNLINK